LLKAKSGRDDLGKEDRWFWENFRGEKDVYVQMLKNVWYAGFYLGSLPRLDIEKMLPRYELLAVKSTEEVADGALEEVKHHLQNLLDALRKMGFDVSDEHSMFASPAQLDVLPSLAIKAHETVKIWATELLSRVQEYIGYHLSRYLKGDSRGVRIRQWNRRELEGWVTQMQKERNLEAGVAVEEEKTLIEY
jgi:hypothetical protein